MVSRLSGIEQFIIFLGVSIRCEKKNYFNGLELCVSIMREYRKKIEEKKNLLSCVRFLGAKLGVRKCARRIHFILLSIKR